MMNLVKKGVLAATLAASALVSAAPAQARDHYRRHGDGGDDAAIAIGAGVIGLALGAAIASDHRDGGYYDNGYYRPRYRTQYYYNSYPVYRRNYYNYRSYPAWRGRDYRNYDNRGWRGHEWREHHGRRGW